MISAYKTGLLAVILKHTDKSRRLFKVKKFGSFLRDIAFFGTFLHKHNLMQGPTLVTCKVSDT